jgi:DNA-binding response OmpR family regulator
MQMPRLDRLLEGENPETGFPQDARHWIAVYREMITFKEELLSRIRMLLSGLPAEARRDVIDSDVSMLEDQLERYRRRLEFWYARQWHLEGLAIDEEARTVVHRGRSVHLTRREFQLLLLLVSRSPSFITPNQLLVQAWHDARLPEETLRTYIGRVRAKLLSLGVAAEIQNRPRRGYALVFSERPKTGPSANGL